MSGIFGLIRLDGAPVSGVDLGNMAALLGRRGPDGTHVWKGRSAGLGHTLLATTPDSLFEVQPLEHAGSGCVITADVRLDNRDELLASLGEARRAATIGDAEIILLTYLKWGEACPEHLLGDFAFAIWDPRSRSLHCARDGFAMRPLYYFHAPGKLFAMASEAQAILVLEQVPHRLNEGRIADYLLGDLEAVGRNLTYFEDIWRLPPGHRLCLTADALRLEQYWKLEPGDEIRLPSDEAYAEAFLDVFTDAVECRLRSAGPVGSMLSGGMDSGSIVAVARQSMTRSSRGPLPTFSAIGPDPDSCVETRTIHAAAGVDGIDPHFVDHSMVGEWMPSLEESIHQLEEPGEGHMTLLRAVNLLARRKGVNTLLDGAAGDIVLGQGSHLTRLLRRGHWLEALCQARGLGRFWAPDQLVWTWMIQAARGAFMPPPIRALRRALTGRRRLERFVEKSMISPDLARRVNIYDRLTDLHGYGAYVPLTDNFALERSGKIDHRDLSVGRERYERVAAAVGVEPRDPFLDRRLVNFCVNLPGEQLLSDGWQKIILRRAMAGRMPEAVRYRSGKEHLGLTFTNALMQKNRDSIRSSIDESRILLDEYLDPSLVDRTLSVYYEGESEKEADDVFVLYCFGDWLGRHSHIL